MITLTLLSKISNSYQLRQVEKALNEPLGELSVDAKIKGTIADRWAQVNLEGEDETIAATYIANEIGICPASMENLKKTTDLKGYITSFEKNTEELLVDVGVFQPKIMCARIPLQRLQAQLETDVEIAPNKIIELWALCRDLPISVNIVQLDEKENLMKAEFSDNQVKKLKIWQESLLDRLLVLGSSLQDVEYVLETEGLRRDIISVETLGLLEYSLVCKLGTDAAGLVPKIGRRLRKAKFAVFNPRKLLSLEL
jgi:hypothetical protein